MKLRKSGSKGTYVELRDRRRRLKRECFTLDDCTPKQAKRLIVEAIVQKRKAG